MNESKRAGVPRPADRIPIAGDVYAPFIDAEVTEERARRASAEQRGLAVISTSGILLTLLVGLVTFGLGEPRGPLSELGRTAVLAALGLFVTAAAFGLRTNMPRTYSEASTDELRRLTGEELWKGDRDIAARRIAEMRVRALRDARDTTDGKVRALKAALSAELFALAAVAVAVADALSKRTG